MSSGLDDNSLRNARKAVTIGKLVPMYTPRGGSIKSIEVNKYWAFLVVQMVKNLPAVRETWVQSLGQEDPLEKGMTTHSSILAWRIPWTEEPGRLQCMGSLNSWT